MSKATALNSTIIGGVDTHNDTHTAAALDATGRVLGNATFPASVAGYETMLVWFRDFGTLERVGIEGTGSYGSGLARHLRDQHIRVVEVNRPNRQTRRRHGKSDGNAPFPVELRVVEAAR
jgi:transposase